MTSEQQKNEEIAESCLTFRNADKLVHRSRNDSKVFVIEALDAKDAAHEKELKSFGINKDEISIAHLKGLVHPVEHQANRIRELEKSLQLLTQERDTEIKRARNAEASLAEKEKRIAVLEGALKGKHWSLCYEENHCHCGTEQILSTPMTSEEK